jgi:hypothetical protein
MKYIRDVMYVKERNILILGILEEKTVSNEKMSLRIDHMIIRVPEQLDPSRVEEVIVDEINDPENHNIFKERDAKLVREEIEGYLKEAVNDPNMNMSGRVQLTEDGGLKW